MENSPRYRRSGTECLQWHTLNGHSARRLPENIRCWLGDRDSLTRQVKRACDGDFRVQVLQQCWTRAHRDEARVLGISAYQRVISREVHLLCGGVPWVYARSLIPRVTLTGHYAVLGQMEDRPLGEKLFADPIMKRGDVTFSWLVRGSHDYSIALTGLHSRPSRIYGRRSLFSGSRAPVMVMEFFLPGIGVFPG